MKNTIVMLITVILLLFLYSISIGLINYMERNKLCKNLPEVNVITDLNTEASVMPRNASLYYNPKTDSLIKGLFLNNTYSIHSRRYTDGSVHYHQIKSDTCVLNIYHYHQMNYRQVESWEIFGHYKDGSIIMLQSVFDLPVHKISPEAYQMIKDKCLENEK